MTDDVAVKKTAAEKLMHTLRELSTPREDAGEMDMMLSSLAMALEGQLGDHIRAAQESGAVDDWVLSMTRFLAIHRSDDRSQLLVVEIPRSAHFRELPPGTRLHLLDQAAEASLEIVNPLTGQ